MTSYRLTLAAQHDLSEVWDFTGERWDIDQANRCVTEIRAAIERIAAGPRRGHACDEIREGYRRCGIGSHLVFYLETADSVDVIRILHQRMDPTRHL